MVSGELRFTVGERSYDAGPGTLVMVPPGAPHAFENAGEVPAVLLTTFTPDLYVDYFRELRSLVQSGAKLTDEAVAQVMTHYATEPATTYASEDEEHPLRPELSDLS